LAFSGYKAREDERARGEQKKGKTVSDGREKKNPCRRDGKKNQETEDEQAEKPEEKTRKKKKPLEREESPGNKHTERTREQPRRTNQNCRTVTPLFLLKETEERVRTREDRDTKKPGGKQRG
jgi:hypothetical protein